MPASAPKRLAFLVAVVVLTAVTTYCSTAVQSSPNDYLMMAIDSTGPICVHLEDPYSERLCPVMAQAEYFSPAQVDAETLWVHTTDNRTIKVAIPNRADAIFLTKSAMSTFLLRHYDANDPTKAAALRTYLGTPGTFKPRRP